MRSPHPLVNVAMAYIIEVGLKKLARWRFFHPSGAGAIYTIIPWHRVPRFWVTVLVARLLWPNLKFRTGKFNRRRFVRIIPPAVPDDFLPEPYCA